MYYLVRIFEINSDSMKEYEFINIESALKCFQNEIIAQLIRITNEQNKYLGENKMLNYESMTSKELKEIAKEKKVKNWWNLKKEEIIIELKKFEVPNLQPKSEIIKKRGQMIEYNGRSQNICTWARELGISANTLYYRIYYKKLSIEEAFKIPAKKEREK